MASHSVDPTEIELGYLADLVFGPELKEELKTRGVKTSRAIYELSSATTQCAKVTGVRDPNGRPCYVCGMPIDESDVIFQGKTRLNQGLTSECEHVLSIAQAIIFLGLYWEKAQRAAQGGVLFYTPAQALQLEYAWAHRTCNQIKSDESFILFNRATNLFEVNFPKIQSYLAEIFTNKRKDSDRFNAQLRSLYRSSRDFVMARTEPLGQTFQAICNYLNSFEAPSMLTLLGAAKVMEGPMNETAAELLSITDRVDNSQFRTLTTVSDAAMVLDKIILDTTKLISPYLRSRFEPYIIEAANKDYDIFLSIILYAPPELKKYTLPYIKIRLLNRLAKRLENFANRQASNVMKVIKNLIYESSMIPSDATAIFREIEQTAEGKSEGGKRRRLKTRRRIRKLSKSLKRK